MNGQILMILHYVNMLQKKDLMQVIYIYINNYYS